MTTFSPVLNPTGLDNGNNTLIRVGDPVNATDASNKQFTTNASNLASGTIAPTILGNSTVYIGTTAVALNRATAAQSLTGITSIDGTAAALTTARTISITGDATWTTTFDGSGNATGALALATSGVTAGTYNSVTVDAKGRVTAGSNTSSSVVVTTGLSGTGTTQSGATALTGDVNVFSTVTGSADAAVLPVPTAGKKVAVINNGASTLMVYPATGAAIDALAVNTPVAIPAGGRLSFDALSTSQWSSGENVIVDGAYIVDGTISNTALTNSSLTLGSTTLTLGGTVSSVAGLTSVSATTFTGALTGDVTGNASTATKLFAGSSISASGDASWTVSFDGSGAVSNTLTLANSGVTAGTYGTASGSMPVMTVDAKGRVTGVTNTPITSLPSGVSVPALVRSSSVSVTAVGVDQSTATALTADVNVVVTAAAGTGVILQSPQAGQAVIVFNSSSNAVTAYPATGHTIDSNSANIGITLNVGTRVVFDAVGSTAWKSSTTNASDTITLGSTAISLGQTATILSGLTSVAATAFTGALTGNASTATKLVTAESITATGDASWTVSFDGSTAVSSALTLTATGIAAGTYNSVTVDTKGRVTAGTAPIVNTGLTATGTDATTGLALTGDVNVFTTVTGSNYAAILPVGVAAKRVTVINDSTSPLTVFAQSGATIDALTAGVGIVVPVNGRLSFDALSSTQWSSTITNVVSGAYIVASSVANAALQNSSLTIGSTSVALGATAHSLVGLTAVSATAFTGALTGNVTGNASSATAAAITDDSATNSSMNLTWVNGNTGNLGISTSSSKLTFNPSTGTLSATKFIGDGSSLTGLPPTLTISTSIPAANAGSGSAGSTGQVSDAGHTHPKLTPAQAGAVGIPASWTPNTSPVLVSGTAPGGTTNAYIASASATLGTAVDGITQITAGDWMVFNTNTTTWNKISGSRISTTGTGVQKGDGSGGLATATAGIDYAAPLLVQSAIPIVMAPTGTIGANGALMIPNTYAFTSTESNVGLEPYYNTGAWMYFQANVITGSNTAGFYWVQMFANYMVLSITAAGSSYTSGVYTGVNLTGGTGTGAQATVVVSGTGTIAAVVVTNVGTGYVANDVLGIDATSGGMGSVGSGASLTVAILNKYGTTGLGAGTISAAGTGYTDGVYTNVPLIQGTATGNGAVATITVVGGAVVAVWFTQAGTGYGTAKTVSVLPASLGGAGSGFSFNITSLGGPMLGTIYNNTYTLGLNTGAWSTGNKSLTPPASPTPFSGTTGTTYSGAGNGIQTYVFAQQIAANSFGNNGSHSIRAVGAASQASTATKSLNLTWGSTAITSGNGLGTVLAITNNSHQAGQITTYMRGGPNYQFTPASDIAIAGTSTYTYTSYTTTSSFYSRLSMIISGSTGVGNGGVIAGGTGYTPGTYVGIPLTGSGSSCYGTVVVNSSGVVTSVTILLPGTGFTGGGTVTASTSIIGAGSGFTYTIPSTLVTGDWFALEAYSLTTTNAPT